ncbi:aldo/keto reductase family protein [Pseudoneobacillus rhizosphaerae]|uniref:L-glyceraldehyde 3-phosphate reductase n=1 Tax=Pseudoneobacillus rhizosphaerae TaxID=2880968 RepID=A0A9C7LBP5_9BACI|nr:aldo/keto reductase family protein [Pseudoneobacillus rhizosphaerae]CAG9609123.1 L-glyceraldehyde 3-phosphate reductase [Pseudoneobacillus rhizosphaerae]
MKYRNLGRSGLKVSEISLGSWLTYGKSVEENVASKIIHRAFELGINFFDSANVYENGRGEVVMANALKSFPREQYIITTKAFWPMGDGPNDKGLSRKHIFEQVHASLRRMNLDYIDIFYCHRYDAETPVEETLRTIDDLLRQGKILYVGVSEWTARQIEEAISVADKYLLDKIVVNQPQYNLFHRVIEEEIIPVSNKHGISQVVFSPLAQGVLTGKYNKGEMPKDSRASKESINMYIKNYLTQEKLNKVGALSEIAAQNNLSLSQLALAWVLSQPNVASAIIGSSKLEQLEENVKASSIVLSEDTLVKVENIISN